MLRRLAALLLVSAEALPTNHGLAKTPAEKRAHFAKIKASSGCRHGHTGGAIIIVTHADHMETLRQLLELQQEVISHAWPPMRMLAARSITAQSLEAAFDHEHTEHVEPNCIVKQDLPKPADPKSTAQIFEGTWASASTPSCTLTIATQRPWSTTATVGNLTGYQPAGKASKFGKQQQVGSKKKFGSVADCDAKTDVAISRSLVINMTSQNHGFIYQMASPPNKRRSSAGARAQQQQSGQILSTGVYEADPMGDMQDQIVWDSGDAWVRTSVSPYNKESSIGPLVADGVETRNYDASPRWNWGLDRLDDATADLDDSFDFGTANGNGTVLYHLDTGVMGSHDDFGGRVLEGYSAGCVTGEEDGCSQGWIKGGILTPNYIKYKLPLLGITLEDHGTHTCSTAIGSKYGVAKEATAYAVQVLDSTGAGSTIDVIAGMLWALYHYNQAFALGNYKPSVASMSLGMNERSQIMTKTAEALNEAGILVVVAAGNDAADACEESPASIPEVLTVAASGITSPQLNADGTLNMDTWEPTDALASFSDFGPCVNIIAPGEEILAAYSSDGSKHLTAALDGTSMATPLTAGVALTIRGLHPSLSPADTHRSLMCIALEDVVGGDYIDPYTSNMLLQGGSRIATEWSELIASQEELTVGQRFNGTKPTWDATRCHVAADEASVSEPSAEVAVKRRTGVRRQQRAALPLQP